MFAALFGDTRLVGSMDRFNFKVPGRAFASLADWPHCDQNPRRVGLRSVQSLLTLLPVTQDGPGIRFYNASHLCFAEYTKPYRGVDKADWFKLPDELCGTVMETYGCNLVKPICPEGSLILWDSRTIHSPTDGTDFAAGRIVFYVCFLPYDEEVFTRKHEQKKAKAFTEMRATTHTPYPQKLFGAKARTYGKDDVKYLELAPEHLFAKRLAAAEDREAELKRCLQPTETEQLLFGFKSYSTLSEGVGLWHKRWTDAPLLPLIAPSTPWLISPQKKEGKRAGGAIRPSSKDKQRRL